MHMGESNTMSYTASKKLLTHLVIPHKLIWEPTLHSNNTINHLHRLCSCLLHNQYTVQSHKYLFINSTNSDSS
jgi:hypothetical protein